MVERGALGLLHASELATLGRGHASVAAQAMPLDPLLLEILVCPESKKALLYFESESFLFCPDSRLKYRIEDDIPVMLIEEAERVSEADAAALVARAPRR